MVLGSFFALFVLGGFSFNPELFDFSLFLLGFFIVGPLLWSALYVLNDLSDLERDKLHEVKRNRVLPSGKLNPLHALIFSIVLIFFALLLGWFVNFLFFLCLLAMLLNQLFYSFKPFHFKSKPVLDLISGSIINPFFRFYAGWVLFVPAFNAPLLAVLFVIGFQFMGFTLYRLNSRELEKKLNFKSSIIVFGERKVKLVSYFFGVIGALSFILMILIPVFFPWLSFLGVLPLRFFLLIVFSALMIPFYVNAIRNPQKMDLKKMYKITYLHYLVFIAFFAVLFWFF
jgi:4-hydroxybenzoate polyprenyltransferase